MRIIENFKVFAPYKNIFTYFITVKYLFLNYSVKRKKNKCYFKIKMYILYQHCVNIRFYLK